MMKSLKLIACGTIVTTKMGKMEGIINGITIRYAAVAYEVAYFDGNRIAQTVWMNEAEFDVTSTETQKIGFK